MRQATINQPPNYRNFYCSTSMSMKSKLGTPNAPNAPKHSTKNQKLEEKRKRKAQHRYFRVLLMKWRGEKERNKNTDENEARIHGWSTWGGPNLFLPSSKTLLHVFMLIEYCMILIIPQKGEIYMMKPEKELNGISDRCMVHSIRY